MIIKRLFDICFAILALMVLMPLLIFIGIAIIATTKGSVFYIQTRVGKNGKEFKLIKFRTMYPNSDKGSLLTIGLNDYRITPVGYWLRKLKLDELPQLINVLKGEMSMVGPRPEVAKYVNIYTPEQLRVLTVKPGITDWASIKYFKENELLEGSDSPETLYISSIIPSKIRQNLEYIDNYSFWMDIRIIYHTLLRIFV